MSMNQVKREIIVSNERCKQLDMKWAWGVHFMKAALWPSTYDLSQWRKSYQLSGASQLSTFSAQGKRSVTYIDYISYFNKKKLLI